MDNKFHNWLEDGKPVEKLEKAIEVLEDLAINSSLIKDDVPANRLSSQLHLMLLRFQQVLEELKAEDRGEG